MSFRGLNRAKIEETARAIILKVTGLPDERVFWARDAQSTVVPRRPFISMFIRTPGLEVRQGELQYAPIFETWRFVVGDDTDGDYAVTISGVEHKITASGLTTTEIRDALVTACGASTTSATTALATVTGETIASDPGDRLVLEVAAPAVGGLTATRVRQNYVQTMTQQTEPVLELFCWGLYNSDSPSHLDYGEDTAEKLLAAFLTESENHEMRLAGCPPRRARLREQDRDLNGERETIGVVEVTLGATICHIVDVGDVREAPFTLTAE